MRDQWTLSGFRLVLGGCALVGMDAGALAQSIVTDGLVGPVQILTGPDYVLPQALGKTAETNLFHSFGQFGLQTGESANFEVSPQTRHIFTRVTGGELSVIDGMLSVTGSEANLFLLNPAGLLFGPNAQLDVRGSFVGTTASSLRFGERGEFSAVTPTAPDLLTLAPTALIFAEPLPGEGASAQWGQIVSRSIASAGTNPLRGELFGLRVPKGKTLSLLGGDVTIDGGNDTDPSRILAGGLNAQEGQIQLGGLGEAGELGLMVSDTGIMAELPKDTALSDVSLVNNARVDVRGNGGGEIAVFANQFLARDGGRLNAGTEGERMGGEIVVNATEVLLTGSVGGTETSGLYLQNDTNFGTRMTGCFGR